MDGASQEMCVLQTVMMNKSFQKHTHLCSFALNWVKLRAWTLEDFDAVLLVDSDVTVVGNITAVFSLPTPFAAVAEQDQGVISYWCEQMCRHSRVGWKRPPKKIDFPPRVPMAGIAAWGGYRAAC